MRDKMKDDYENVGIMQGFLDDMGEEEDALEEEEGSDEAVAAKMLDRRVDSPEILMNNLRGDMRSVDARREELADLVGYEAASETPDSVLAMLQPVLAQGGGIGALPQSGPMAQGPQAPMPPPPGGAMGTPPPGAPPLPPGGAAPPPGGDMAALLAAGPPPGGGMAPPGPMVGPDGQPIPPEGMPPIQMKDGGYVQRFRDGSPDPDEEDEETQKTGLDSFAGLASMSPEIMELAANRARQVLTQKPEKIETREAAMKRLVPEYESLVGGDPGMAKANLYFDLARAGLNLAANVGPRGEPLRGSAISRFAGAFSGIPDAIQKRLGDLEKTKQQVRLLALEAGEKERGRLMDYNTKLAQESNDLVIKLMEAKAKSDRAGTGGSFGSSQSGRVMNIFETLTPGFSAGRTSPVEDRRFVLAVEDYLKPTTYMDPASKEQRLLLPSLPQYVEKALTNRGFSIYVDPNNINVRKVTSSDPSTMDYLLGLQSMGGTGAPGEAAAPASAPAAPVAAPRTMGGGPSVSTPALSGTGPTVMGGRTPAGTVDTSTLGSEPPLTLVDVLPGYGIGPTIRRGLSKLPVSAAGEAFGEDESLMTTGRNITADLRAMYTDASRVLASEREEIVKAIDGIPKLMGNAPLAFKEFVALSMNLERKRDDAFRVAQDPQALQAALNSPELQNYGIDTREKYLLNAQKFQDMINAIGVHPIRTPEQLQERLAKCKPGEPCMLTLYSEKNGRWERVPVTPPEQ
jgi:hypothetical protein